MPLSDIYGNSTFCNHCVLEKVFTSSPAALNYAREAAAHSRQANTSEVHPREGRARAAFQEVPRHRTGQRKEREQNGAWDRRPPFPRRLDLVMTVRIPSEEAINTFLTKPGNHLGLAPTPLIVGFTKALRLGKACGRCWMKVPVIRGRTQGRVCGRRPSLTSWPGGSGGPGTAPRAEVRPETPLALQDACRAGGVSVSLVPTEMLTSEAAATDPANLSGPGFCLFCRSGYCCVSEPCIQTQRFSVAQR